MAEKEGKSIGGIRCIDHFAPFHFIFRKGGIGGVRERRHGNAGEQEEGERRTEEEGEEEEEEEEWRGKEIDGREVNVDSPDSVAPGTQLE